MIIAERDGAVTLHYDNAAKLATTSEGINVTGKILADEELFIESASGFAALEMGGPSGAFIDMKAPFSDDYDGRILYDTGAGGALIISTNGSNSAPVVIKQQDSEKLRTSTLGVEVTGEFITDSYNETYAALSGTSPAVNCETGNSFSLVLSGATTFTFTNPPASGTAYTFSVEIIQDSGGSGHTVTWPSSVDWPAATAPTLTADANAKDIFVFTTRDGGTNWYGFTAGQALGQGASHMATKKKMLMSAAGAAGGAGLDIDEVFSTYLYEGSGYPQTITNNIDLSGEGGMTWIKSRSNGALDHVVVDTVRGADNSLKPNLKDANEGSGFYSITAFNNNGFTLDSADGSGGNVNNNGDDFVSWSFRKAPKFFDVVTWDGNNTAGREIAHNLGTTVGTIIVKCTSNSSTAWTIYHRSLGSTKYLEFDTGAQGNAGTAYWNATEPTSSVFTLGNDGTVNATGRSYVAYLFAHNDGDGEFGPDGDADVIKCGSYTGNGNDDGPVIDLGFEPQWLMIKNTTDADSWWMFDTMRGMAVDAIDPALWADGSNAEVSTGEPGISPTPTGFKVTTNQGFLNNNNSNLIYIAIRRGPLAPPESGTEVFVPVQGVGSGVGNPAFASTFTTDAAIFLYPNGGTSFPKISSRLTGATFLETHSTNTEAASDYTKWDFQTGAGNGGELTSAWNGLLWKRAPGFCDVVAYKGTGSGTQVLNHNLGVTPELVIQKGRSIGTNWTVAAKITGTTFRKGNLNGEGSLQEITYATDQRYFTNFSDTTITIGNDLNSNDTHIMYLFASLDGVSKVGTFSTSYSDLVVDCGFTTGARFVLLKRIPTALGSWDSWFIFDSVRGITSSADDFLELNTTDAESTDGNNIEAHSSGFKIKNGGGLNFANGNEFVFYAIA